MYEPVSLLTLPHTVLLLVVVVMIGSGRGRPKQISSFLIAAATSFMTNSIRLGLPKMSIATREAQAARSWLSPVHRNRASRPAIKRMVGVEHLAHDGWSRVLIEANVAREWHRCIYKVTPLITSLTPRTNRPFHFPFAQAPDETKSRNKQNAPHCLQRGFSEISRESRTGLPTPTPNYFLLMFRRLCFCKFSIESIHWN